ncbi:hypothetical protein NC653_009352 [Populus alba x Populus x berolinensis]|uniref:Uncharacterized protein n=1 Tax=Populus alba x Populus x berolinensis TaxID=444605 RepID=A0AAD6R8Q6_9ROSI|nr:hypothetical protein NC653_009352 [Populus alba x Populus x berolinensis]
MGFYGVDDAVGLWCDFGNWFFMAFGFVFSFATYVVLFSNLGAKFYRQFFCAQGVRQNAQGLP